MNKKRAIVFMTTIVMILAISLTGCGGGNGDGGNEFSLDISATADRLISEGAFDDQMTTIDLDTAMSLYGLTTEQVEDVAVYIGTGATAEEVAVFKAIDAEQAAVVKTACTQRVENQKTAYATYKPEEIPKLDAAIVTDKGQYVILCISADASFAQGIIDDCLK